MTLSTRVRGVLATVFFVSAAACGVTTDDDQAPDDPAEPQARGGGKPPAADPVLSTLTFSSATVPGGAPATGIITFASTTDGAFVPLTSNNPSVVGVPSGGLVAGQQSVGFYPITTNAVTASIQVAITGSVFGVTRTGILTVVPATAPPVPDTVRVTSASWKAGHLRINATSTTRLAILQVLLASNNSLMFTMYPAGQNGTYSVDRPWVFNPEHMILQSNFGGSAPVNTVP